MGCDEIVEIVEDGEEDVYDIEVDRTHNFIAAGVQVSNTRWHEDDLGGRLLAASANDPEADQWEVIRLPAIAEPDRTEGVDLKSVDAVEQWRDRIGRRMGEALWPRRYDVAALRQIEKSVGPLVWEASFQQRPSKPTGGMFDPTKWGAVTGIPHGSTFCRRWDLAATEEKPKADPDWTAGVLLARTPQGRTIVVDVVRERKEPHEVELLIARTHKRDDAVYGEGQRKIPVRMAVDPGQAGKAQASHYSRNVLPTADFAFDHEIDAKTSRAIPWSSQQQAGNIDLLYVPGQPALWQQTFIEEHRQFPRGAHDDQVDAAALAYDMLAGGNVLKTSTYTRQTRGR